MTKELSTSRVITISGVRAYLDENGTAWINAEDAARGLGFCQNQIKNGKEYEFIRWNRINEYLNEFNFPPQVVEKASDSYLPENIFYRLAMKAKNEVAEKFQALVADEILPTLRKTGKYELPHAKPESEPYTIVGKGVSDVEMLTNKIQSLFAVKRGIAISKAIDTVSANLNLNLDAIKQLLPPAEHETGFMNATELGKKLGGLKPRVINKLLEQAELQYKDNKSWRLTEKGRNYAEEFPFTRNGHSDYRIGWSETTVDFMNNFIH